MNSPTTTADKIDTPFDAAGTANGSAGVYGLSGSPTLYFSPRHIRQIAKKQGPRGQVITTYLKQGWVEWQLRLRGSGHFRSNQNQRAVEGYARMKPQEFEAINAVQSWANWRTIPRNLTGRLPARPVRALDLCSGSGDSTQVLACYAAAGSHITGIEIDPRFVALARSRTYNTFDNQPQHVDFVVRDVLAPFINAKKQPIENHSVDLINVTGAVAVHFDAKSTAKLASQCANVVKPQGLALVDAGYEGASPRVVRNCFESNGFTLIHEARSCLLDLSRQLCFRRDS